MIPLDAFVAVRELLERPAWMRDALCKEYPRAWWFPTRGESVVEAKAICRCCAVQFECLEYALTTGSSGCGVARLRRNGAAW